MHNVMKPFGLLNVCKPSGCTSRAVVDRVEQCVAPAKAGHAGTLDPLASGVLVICVGKATRLIEYVQRMPKHYRATFLFGRRSETDDIEGEVVEVADAPAPTLATLEAVLPRFRGQIQQRPPAHSAVKVRGRRAYNLARAGIAVDLKPRPVTIHALYVLRYDYPELELAIECGSGTYVRSLGRDLAEALGTAAVMSALVRTSIGSFRIEDAIALAALDSVAVQQHLKPPIAAVEDLPIVRVTAKQLEEIRHGRPINPQGAIDQPDAVEWAAVDSEGWLVAVMRQKQPGQLWPDKMFA